MLHAALAGCVVWAILQMLERNQDRGIDGWVSFVLFLVPALLIFLLSIGIGMAGLPQWLILIASCLYFLVPTFILKFQFELSWARSAAYGGIVFVSAIAVEALLFYGFASMSGY